MIDLGYMRAHQVVSYLPGMSQCLFIVFEYDLINIFSLFNLKLLNHDEVLQLNFAPTSKLVKSVA